VKLFALTTWCPYPMVNGSTLRMYHLLRALASRYEVELVTFSAPAAPDAAAVAHLRTFCHEVTVIPKSPFVALRESGAALLSGTPRSLVATDDPDVRALVRRRAAGASAAIGFALHAARYLEESPGPRIFEEAEPGQIAGQLAHAANALRRFRLHLTWRKQARYLAQLARGMAAVTVASAAERDRLVGIGVPADKVHLVPNGADGADLSRPRVVETPPRLIYSGAVTYAPNLEAVVWFQNQVMPRLRASRPDPSLWVTGDTGTIPLERLPHRDRVHFTGRLPDVKGAVAGSAIAVVPLQTGGGTRLKVLEALALGTPVVSTSKGVEGIDLTDGVHALVADTPEAFAAAILRVLDDSDLAARLSAAGRALIADTYTWDAIGRRLVDVVDGAIERTRP
jgi:glycosyltransferase involved in cell wall biosynthesis